VGGWRGDGLCPLCRPPVYEEHIRLASLISLWTASLLERKTLKDARSELESVQRQMRLQDDLFQRFPMNFVPPRLYQGYSTSLLRQDTTWDENTQREFLTIIDEETDRLTQLIDNMLESAACKAKPFSSSSSLCAWMR